MIDHTTPGQAKAANLRPFIGEEWGREVWYEWGSMLLALQWDGAGRPMPPEWCEFSDFIAEWFRALFEDGKAAGFVVYEKR